MTSIMPGRAMLRFFMVSMVHRERFLELAADFFFEIVYTQSKRSFQID